MGGFYNVRTAAGTYACKPRGIFRKEKTILLVGDRVRIEPLPDGAGVITELMARKNCFARPPISNLDKLFIVLSTTKPEPDLFFADKLTVVCAAAGRTVVVVNKSDLRAPDSVAAAYEKAGYAVVAASAKTGMGLEEILRLARGAVSAFAGFSGAGKSSLLSRLLPERLETGAVSEKLGAAGTLPGTPSCFPLRRILYRRHTAGFSSLDMLRNLSLKKEELQNAFPEFKPLSRPVPLERLHAPGKRNGTAPSAPPWRTGRSPPRELLRPARAARRAPRLGIAPQRACRDPAAAQPHPPGRGPRRKKPAQSPREPEPKARLRTRALFLVHFIAPNGALFFAAGKKAARCQCVRKPQSEPQCPAAFLTYMKYKKDSTAVFPVKSQTWQNQCRLSGEMAQCLPNLTPAGVIFSLMALPCTG